MKKKKRLNKAFHLLHNCSAYLLENKGIKYYLFDFCKYGMYNCCLFCLDNEYVDPSVDGNHAILFASKYGHLKAVNRLLEDERVDPSDRKNNAIIWHLRRVILVL